MSVNQHTQEVKMDDLREEMRAMAADARAIRELLEAQKQSMDNLDTHIDFIHRVYSQIVRSPYQWLCDAQRRVIGE